MIVEVLAWNGAVGDGRTDSQYCTIGAVAKFGEERDGYVAANEFICANLGIALGLPIPPCALIRNERDRLGIVSLRVGPKGEKPPPVDVAEFIQDQRSVAIDVLAFDSWVHNTDRNSVNLVYSRAGNIAPAVIDHDQSLFHIFPERGMVHLKQHVDEPLAQHPLAAAVQDEAHLNAAIDRIRLVPSFMIERTCTQLVRAKAITSEEASAVLSFLKSRAANLNDLIAPLIQPKQRSLV